MADPVDAWIDALVTRHTRDFTTSEFLKAVRALSARYVERRAHLGTRPATDSAGKRAAFAAYYAPLHFLVVRAIVEALGLSAHAATRLVDLGCGTGTASAAWALALAAPPAIHGVDRDAWSLDQAQWNWQALGLGGRTSRGDLVREAAPLLDPRRRPLDTTAVLLAWSVNELDDEHRARLAPTLLAAAAGGASVLVVEPLARAAAPWWDTWAAAWQQAGGRADVWKFDRPLPPHLDQLREAAGFGPSPLGARSLWLPGASAARATIS